LQIAICAKAGSSLLQIAAEQAEFVRFAFSNPVTGLRHI
jgi:hypothetical protein